MDLLNWCKKDAPILRIVIKDTNETIQYGSGDVRLMRPPYPNGSAQTPCETRRSRSSPSESRRYWRDSGQPSSNSMDNPVDLRRLENRIGQLESKLATIKKRARKRREECASPVAPECDSQSAPAYTNQKSSCDAQCAPKCPTRPPSSPLHLKPECGTQQKLESPPQSFQKRRDQQRHESAPPIPVECETQLNTEFSSQKESKCASQPQLELSHQRVSLSKEDNFYCSDDDFQSKDKNNFKKKEKSRKKVKQPKKEKTKLRKRKHKKCSIYQVQDNSEGFMAIRDSDAEGGYCKDCSTASCSGDSLNQIISNEQKDNVKDDCISCIKQSEKVENKKRCLGPENKETDVCHQTINSSRGKWVNEMAEKGQEEPPSTSGVLQSASHTSVHQANVSSGLEDSIVTIASPGDIVTNDTLINTNKINTASDAVINPHPVTKGKRLKAILSLKTTSLNKKFRFKNFRSQSKKQSVILDTDKSKENKVINKKRKSFKNTLEDSESICDSFKNLRPESKDKKRSKSKDNKPKAESPALISDPVDDLNSNKASIVRIEKINFDESDSYIQTQRRNSSKGTLIPVIAEQDKESLLINKKEATLEARIRCTQCDESRDKSLSNCPIMKQVHNAQLSKNIIANKETGVAKSISLSQNLKPDDSSKIVSDTFLRDSAHNKYEQSPSNMKSTNIYNAENDELSLPKTQGIFARPLNIFQPIKSNNRSQQVQKRTESSFRFQSSKNKLQCEISYQSPQLSTQTGVSSFMQCLSGKKIQSDVNSQSQRPISKNNTDFNMESGHDFKRKEINSSNQSHIKPPQKETVIQTQMQNKKSLEETKHQIQRHGYEPPQKEIIFNKVMNVQSQTNALHNQSQTKSDGNTLKKQNQNIPLQRKSSFQRINSTNELSRNKITHSTQFQNLMSQNDTSSQQKVQSNDSMSTDSTITESSVKQVFTFQQEPEINFSRKLFPQTQQQSNGDRRNNYFNNNDQLRDCNELQVNSMYKSCIKVSPMKKTSNETIRSPNVRTFQRKSKYSKTKLNILPSKISFIKRAQKRMPEKKKTIQSTAGPSRDSGDEDANIKFIDSKKKISEKAKERAKHMLAQKVFFR